MQVLTSRVTRWPNWTETGHRYQAAVLFMLPRLGPSVGRSFTAEGDSHENAVARLVRQCHDLGYTLPEGLTWAKGWVRPT